MCAEVGGNDNTKQRKSFLISNNSYQLYSADSILDVALSALKYELIWFLEGLYENLLAELIFYFHFF